jgi:class 3 adenylate cyclase
MRAGRVDAGGGGLVHRPDEDGDMTRTIAERLSESAGASFVGRDAELATLREAIAADEPPFLVAYVHGPGGIGKSSLLESAVAGAGPGVRVLSLDCARVEPTPRGFLEAVDGAFDGATDGRCVLALDTYETFGLMDSWLRQSFIPSLPETAVTLIASREPPRPGWLTSAGWAGLFHQIRLRGLDRGESLTMLTRRGLTAEQADRASRFAHGHPLALELAAAALRAQPDLELTDGPPPLILQQLTQAFLSGLSPEAAEAVEGASILRRLTEPSLAAVLGAPSGRAAFDEIRGLPFVDATDEGLAIHAVVREAVARDLATRDPARHRRYRRRAWRHLTDESRAAAGLSLWQQTADLLFLVQSPQVREAFFPAGAAQMTVEPAGPADGAALAAIAAAAEPPEGAELMNRWLRDLPGSAHVARDGAGEVAGMYLLFEPDDATSDQLAADPVTAAWARHLAEHPVDAGERVLFLRRWLDRATGDLPSDAQAACWLDVKRTYMEMRSSLRRLYTVAREPGAHALGALGFRALPEAEVTVGAATYHTVMLDFGAESVVGWLGRLAEVDDVADDDPVLDAAIPDGTVTIMFTDIAGSTALTEQLGDAAFRSLARRTDGALRACVGEAGGAVVEGKLLGDGMLAVFTSAGPAVECAVRCLAAARGTGLALHVGLHAGDVIREGGDIFGGAVNLAARVAAEAPAGQVLVSETVRGLALTSGRVAFADRGPRSLKGFSEPVRLYQVGPA